MPQDCRQRRRALVRPSRARLQGGVEVHATYVGGEAEAVHAFFFSTHVGLIHLHTALEAISAGPNYRPPQFMEPTPSCLVAAQAEQLLQTQRAPA